MKWKNFQRLLRRNPELKDILRSVLGWAVNSNGSKETVAEFESMVEFIRVRPFDPAILDKTGGYEETESESIVQQCRAGYRFEGGALPCRFRERGDCMSEDSETVQQLLARCLQEQQRTSYRVTHWGQKVVIDFVMVNTIIIEHGVDGTRLEGARRENVDLYRVPANYSPLTV